MSWKTEKMEAFEQICPNLYLSFIFAVGKNGSFGKDGGLCWDLPTDRAFFRRQIEGRTCIVGRKTYESLPKSIKRLAHMVVLSTSHVELFGQHEQYDKLAEALLDYPESVVIGGAQTLSRALDYCRIGFVTVVEDEPETDCDVRLGDTLGPEWVKEELAHKKAGTCFVEEGGEDEYNFSIYLVTRVGK